MTTLEVLGLQDLQECLRRMLRIRTFESEVTKLYRAGEVPGFVHVCIGQEASAVGSCWPLRQDDVITSTHRGHGHCLAKGLDVRNMLAELMGRASGTCKGRGGSMHIADPAQGVFGANGIVGAGIPIAVGAALAARLRGSDSVAVAYFGDGAVAQGAFYEAVNLAVLWRLPVVFFCENNHYAEFSLADDQHAVSLATRALGQGLEHVLVDGGDVVEVARATADVVAGLRAGGPPVIIEADTYRWHGHYVGDPERYRASEEVEAHKAADVDPIARTRVALVAAGVEEAAIDAIEAETVAEIADAIEWARAEAPADPAGLAEFVYAPATAVDEQPVDVEAEPFRIMDAVHDALAHELEADERVFVAGIDVAEGGNVFGITRGLHDSWPERVRDTPIAETSLVGAAVGAALAGMRPVIEIMYLDFIGVCFDQLLNQAAKLRFMTGGSCSVPLVVRTQTGVGRSSGSQHSQSLEALLAHIPGLTVVMPSNPADAYGLLRSAIEDPNPVVFIENRNLYGRKGPRPDPDHRVPLGRASIVREGSDLTVVAWSAGVELADAAAERLAGEGISAEVIDLRTVQPLDRATVLASLERTGRLLVTQQAVVEFGVASELARLAAGEGFWHLDVPVAVVAPPFTPVPYATSLEERWIPSVDDLTAAARALARA